MDPYYSDDLVTLYHGDCRDIIEWLTADVLVTDPPYGIGYRRGKWAGERGQGGHDGIAGDLDTSVRDDVLKLWGVQRPALVFGSLRAAYPAGWHKMLVFGKPTVGCGLFGQRDPWFANWEPIFVLGDWPDQTPTRSAIVATRYPSASGYNGYATVAGHAHAKPLDVMESLVEACPPGMIADPCAGRGSTLIAARNLGRPAVGVELEELHCERAARRLQQDVLPLEA